LKGNGKRVFRVALAGIGISFCLEGNIHGSLFQGRSGAFGAPGQGREDIRLHVVKGSLPSMKIMERVFDSGTTWALYRSEKRYVLQDHALEGDSRPTRLLVLEPDLRSGYLYLENESPAYGQPTDPLGYPLNQLLIILLLKEGRGILVHACGIEDRGEGYLFLGRSGDGKSTMGEIWHRKGAQVLNDDRIIIREEKGAFRMYGTPWHGTFKECSPKGVPVSRIFSLGKGKQNSIIRAERSQALSGILTRAFPPLWDRKGMDFTLELCHRMVDAVPCYNLDFRPDEEVVEFIRGTTYPDA